ncbi:phage portal protein, partial [Staphylococcus epidermidis]
MFNRAKAFWNKLFLDPLADAREQSIFKMMNNYTPTFNYVENPYDTKIVRKAVHTIATNGAKLRAKHIRKKDGKLEVQSTNFEYLLNIRPNYFMSAFDFLVRLVVSEMSLRESSVTIEQLVKHGKIVRPSIGIGLF